VITDPEEKPEIFPVLPLRDIVVFPHMIVPLFVGREKSVQALDEVMRAGRKIVLLAQKDPACDDPGEGDLYNVGTTGNILQLLKLPDGTIKVLVEGQNRIKIQSIEYGEDCLRANSHKLSEPEEDQKEIAAVAKSIIRQFDEYVKLNRKLPQEVLTAVSSIEDMSKLSDTIAAHLNLKIEDKQVLLGMPGVIDRLERLYGLMEEEMDLFQIEKRIRGRVKKQMEKSQREYYLGEQIKAIQKELGDEDGQGDLVELQTRIKAAGMPVEALAKSESELKKLKMMPPMSAEATVVRNYIDWLVSIPWRKHTRVRRDLAVAAEVLDTDHYGLEKVKERILEYLAVLRLVRKMKGPVLCFVGPPGVGKTSLGKSIARATNRKFVRMSLGGVRDEAEIRGHRRTYIGALPGKIIQSMKKAGTKNPLFLLDEVDKMGTDFRGDPASALLEVLDPEQNHAFNDHYLDMDYDLSEVMFITTANTMNIPWALRDRMELIRIPGYTEDEKLIIATQHLLPKKLRTHGLSAERLKISKQAMIDIIRYYTQEAGVRNLDRELAKMCRKAAMEVVQSGKKNISVSVQSSDLERYLGVQRFRFGIAEQENQVGVITGLAWTEVGGELLQIETALMPGKGKLTITGQIGEVMQESVQAALTYVRSRAVTLGLNPDFHQKVDIHVHVPEGSIPKDGPSAGLAMATSIASALTGIAIRKEVCMTGEITLRGKALPIGGLKEKLLAARRGGLTLVLIPEENAKDLKDVPENIVCGLKIKTVANMDEVLEQALLHIPEGMRTRPKFIPMSIAGVQGNGDSARAH